MTVNNAPVTNQAGLTYKIAGAEFKINDDADFEGHFAVFNNMDDGGDVILTGAFSKTIKENGHRVKVLYQHYPDRIIGGKPLLQEDTMGLYARGKIIKDTFWGREAHILMKEGALNEGSIGYMPVWDKTEWRDDGARLLREVKLFEVSPVPWGMNPLTEVSALKAMFDTLNRADIPDAVKARQANDYLDTLVKITDEIKAGRVLSAANKTKVKDAKTAMQAAIEALDAVLQAAEPDEDGKSVHSTLERTQMLRDRIADAERRMSRYTNLIG
jgi:HK97 family phage prohead protease